MNTVEIFRCLTNRLKAEHSLRAVLTESDLLQLSGIRAHNGTNEHNEKKRDPNTNMWLYSFFGEHYDGRVH